MIEIKCFNCDATVYSYFSFYTSNFTGYRVKAQNVNIGNETLGYPVMFKVKISPFVSDLGEVRVSEWYINGVRGLTGSVMQLLM